MGRAWVRARPPQELLFEFQKKLRSLFSPPLEGRGIKRGGVKSPLQESPSPPGRASLRRQPKGGEREGIKRALVKNFRRALHNSALRRKAQADERHLKFLIRERGRRLGLRPSLAELNYLFL